MTSRMLVHLLGLWMVLFSVVLLPPVFIAALYRDGALVYFINALVLTLLAGLMLWRSGDRITRQLRLRDGFVVVVCLWVATSVLAALVLRFALDTSFTDALFESVSALTTTGATVLSGLDHMPKSVLFFRQSLQWLGGIGVIVSAVALMPMLGIGGMQLMKAETPGPQKSEKLTPRIAHTAGVLWRLYLAITVLCALAFWAAGMDLFDAVTHSFATVSTGGFSTYDASFAHFDSAVIEAIASAFMLVGAINFGVHWVAWRGMSFEAYRDNEEVRWFMAIVLASVMVVTVVLWLTGERDSLASALRLGSFTVVSVITSTGFTTEDFSAWASMLPVFLILASFIGGCGGSTSGGMKVIRVMVVWRAMQQQFFLLTHPRSVRPVRVGGQVVDTRVLDGVLGFTTVHILLVIALTLVNMALGMDGVSAFSGVASSINNLGPALGTVSASFASAPEASKWVFSAVMLLGRLEIFTVLVLFTPSFWRG